jgi:putative addiction module antidote
MTSVKVTIVDGAAGIVLPDEVLRRLRISEGDVLDIVETANGVELTPHDPQIAEQLAIAERVMRSDRNVLKKLAE